MRQLIASGVLLGIVLAISLTVSAVNGDSGIGAGYNSAPSTLFFKEFKEEIVGSWQSSGEQFTRIQSTLVGKTFVYVLIIVPVIFLLHFLIIGTQKFSHEGEKILFFNGITRCIHSIGALSFSLLVLSGR